MGSLSDTWTGMFLVLLTSGMALIWGGVELLWWIISSTYISFG